MAQRRIANTCEPAKQTEIELPLAAVPAVIPGCGRVLQNRGQLTRGKLAKIGATQRAAGLAQEFDAAERAAAKRVQPTRPGFANAFDSVADIGVENFAIDRAASAGGEAGKADAGRAMAPLA